MYVYYRVDQISSDATSRHSSCQSSFLSINGSKICSSYQSNKDNVYIIKNHNVEILFEAIPDYNFRFRVTYVKSK